MTDPDRILLLITSASYRAGAFLEAAGRLGVAVTVGSDHRNALGDEAPDSTIALDFEDVEASRAVVERLHGRRRLAAVVAAEDDGVVLAATLAAALGLRGNTVEAVTCCRHKDRFRAALSSLDVPSPRFLVADAGEDPEALATRVEFPCVIKPVSMSASRGVIRADDPEEFVRAFRESARVARGSAERGGGTGTPPRPGPGHDAGAWLLVESYIPGDEVALEGLLIDGALRTLAILDKPDPLTGPYFEETMFVAPSRHPDLLQREIVDTVSRVANHIGLREGPVHAELRLDETGVWPIEIAPRTIGGQCARLFEVRTGTALEELVLLHALGRRVPDPVARRASGALMIPIPRSGVFRGLDGVHEARAVAGIEDVTLTVHPGQRIETLPRGNRYLGFVFARGPGPEDVEAALRAAHRRLRVRIEDG